MKSQPIADAPRSAAEPTGQRERQRQTATANGKRQDCQDWQDWRDVSRDGRDPPARNPVNPAILSAVRCHPEHRRGAFYGVLVAGSATMTSRKVPPIVTALLRLCISVPSRRAHVRQRTDTAARDFRLTDPAAVEDQQVGEHRPAIAREQAHQLLFHLHGIRLAR